MHLQCWTLLGRQRIALYYQRNQGPGALVVTTPPRAQRPNWQLPPQHCESRQQDSPGFKQRGQVVVASAQGGSTEASASARPGQSCACRCAAPVLSKIVPGALAPLCADGSPVEALLLDAPSHSHLQTTMGPCVSSAQGRHRQGTGKVLGGRRLTNAAPGFRWAARPQLGWKCRAPHATAQCQGGRSQWAKLSCAAKQGCRGLARDSPRHGLALARRSGSLPISQNSHWRTGWREPARTGRPESRQRPQGRPPAAAECEPPFYALIA